MRTFSSLLTSGRVDWLWLLSGLALVGFAAGLLLALVHAPTSEVQGEVQRIFYLHLAASVGAFVGFISAAIAGVAHLRSRRIEWDMLAHAGIEVGLLLALINVVTGAIYARPIINSWWTWDPKLTAVTIMMLTYTSYLMLRNGVESPDRRRLFAAVYSIIAFVTVINTFMVIRLRPDTLHDVMFGPGSALFSMPARMQLALFGNMLVWGGLIAPALIGWRVRLERFNHANDRLRLRLLDGERR